MSCNFRWQIPTRIFLSRGCAHPGTDPAHDISRFMLKRGREDTDVETGGRFGFRSGVSAGMYAPVQTSLGLGLVGGRAGP